MMKSNKILAVFLLINEFASLENVSLVVRADQPVHCKYTSTHNSISHSDSLPSVNRKCVLPRIPLEMNKKFFVFLLIPFA